jgi:carboxymethylenebutenolidase
VIGFYGVVNGPLYTEGTGRVAEQARRTRVPVLGLFGGTDQYVPVSAVEQFEQGLASAAVNHEIVIYPDVPHSFFDRRAEEFAEVADDAWRRVLAFIAAHSVQGKEQGS